MQRGPEVEAAIADPPPLSDRSLLAAGASLVVVVVITLYSATYLLGERAAELPGERTYQEIAAPYFPQGWAFFTKSPRTPELLAYRYEPGGDDAASLVLGPNAQARWAFGLDRTPRTQEFEYEVLSRALSDESWFECSGPVGGECIEDAGRAGPSIEIVNDLPASTICGDDIVLVRAGVFPWAFANRGFDPGGAVDEVVLANVECR